MIFTNLAQHMDVDFLREAYRRSRKSGAPGVDKVTAKDYEQNLEANLLDLHERLRSGRYVAPPVKREWIDKEDGSKRPLGLLTFEDKIVQRAVLMLLEAIYEQDFHDVSYGFRIKRGPQKALKELREECMRGNVGWIPDADISGFFDNLDKGQLREFIKQRVNDGAILRLIGKWLNAGVLDGITLTHPETGTPQGAVISPILANIYLHYVLDEWYLKEVRPRLRGRSKLVRFADDFVISFEQEADAQRVMAVLPKRFARFGLMIHPEKTKLIAFRKPAANTTAGKGKGTFDFLGFTHYWARSRFGYWVIKRKTASKRMRRAMKRHWQCCRDNRHLPLEEQYKALCQKLRGYYQYFGVRCNMQQLKVLYKHMEEAWKYWLSRRSRKGTVSYEKLEKLRLILPLPKPRIVHDF